MTRYPSPLIFLGYPSILDKKINKKKFNSILQITSPKVHLAQIHLHIVLILPLGRDQPLSK